MDRARDDGSREDEQTTELQSLAGAQGQVALDALRDGKTIVEIAQKHGVHPNTQFTGHDRQDFMRDHNLVCSMSRRGNCHDNAIAESFFQLLTLERIRRPIYPSLDQARVGVFNYIEMFYNSTGRHGTAGDMSPVAFERRHFQRLSSV